MAYASRAAQTGADSRNTNHTSQTTFPLALNHCSFLNDRQAHSADSSLCKSLGHFWYFSVPVHTSVKLQAPQKSPDPQPLVFPSIHLG